jgi:hypothetical protein
VGEGFAEPLCRAGDRYDLACEPGSVRHRRAALPVTTCNGGS